MRFFCVGKVVEWDEAAFPALLRRMGKERIEGARAVILLDIFKVRFFLPLPLPLPSTLPYIPLSELCIVCTLS